MELIKEFKSIKDLNGSHAQQLGIDPEILTAPAWALSAYLTDYKNFIPALRARCSKISRGFSH